jgi:hypothetical protein
VQDAFTAPVTVSVIVKVPPDNDPTMLIEYDNPQPSVNVVAGNTTLLPLAVPEIVIFFTQPGLPTVPVPLTVFPLAVHTKLVVPELQPDVPVQVPANCAPSFPLLLDFVHDETAINVIIVMLARTPTMPLKIVCSLCVITFIFEL